MNDKLQIKKLYALSSENRKFSFLLALKNKIRIGKRDYLVQLKADENMALISCGKTGNIQLRLSGRVRINMKFFLTILVTHSQLKLHFSLQRMKVLKLQKRETEQENVKAPMPGKIIDILVREGSNVLRGEPMIILEAMKCKMKFNLPSTEKY